MTNNSPSLFGRFEVSGVLCRLSAPTHEERSRNPLVFPLSSQRHLTASRRKKNWPKRKRPREGSRHGCPLEQLKERNLSPVNHAPPLESLSSDCRGRYLESHYCAVSGIRVRKTDSRMDHTASGWERLYQPQKGV